MPKFSSILRAASMRPPFKAARHVFAYCACLSFAVSFNNCFQRPLRSRFAGELSSQATALEVCLKASWIASGSLPRPRRRTDSRPQRSLLHRHSSTDPPRQRFRAAHICPTESTLGAPRRALSDSVVCASAVQPRRRAAKRWAGAAVLPRAQPGARRLDCPRARHARLSPRHPAPRVCPDSS